MVAEINEQVAIQEYQPRTDKTPVKTAYTTGIDKNGSPVIVSKDFILGLLSLAVGKPFFLEGNLGGKVDVKV
ncbi:MAG TPA: hypothetical protein ENI15_00315 [Spirochaetes bacterium]|nr:hypothetical protein [Spirochaetota bacterium]